MGLCTQSGGRGDLRRGDLGRPWVGAGAWRAADGLVWAGDLGRVGGKGKPVTVMETEELETQVVDVVAVAMSVCTGWLLSRGGLVLVMTPFSTSTGSMIKATSCQSASPSSNGGREMRRAGAAGGTGLKFVSESTTARGPATLTVLCPCQYWEETAWRAGEQSVVGGDWSVNR